MRFVTVATEEDERFERLLGSCRHFGVNLVNLGKNRCYLGHGTKIVLLIEYLKTLDPGEIVVFTDAYDVLYVRDPGDLEVTFSAFDHPLVFSAEQNFAYADYDASLERKLTRFRYWLKYPRGKLPFTRYRFLHAGCFIGHAGHTLRVLGQLDVDETHMCDQTVLHEHFLQSPNDMVLDYAHRIFTNTAGRDGLEGLDFSIVGMGVRNNNTMTFPYIIHFPGRNLVGYNKIVEQLPHLGPPLPIAVQDLRRYRRMRKGNVVSNWLGIGNYTLTLLETLGKLCLVGTLAVVVVLSLR